MKLSRLLSSVASVVLTSSALSVAGAAVVGSPTALADTPVAGPFACSTPTDYLSLGFNEVSGSARQIQLYASTESADAPSWSAVGSATPASAFTTDVYNAIGIDPVDDYMYGIGEYTDHLLRIDNAGGVHDLGAITGLPATTDVWASGAFTPDGHLWMVNRGNETVVYDVDVATVSVTGHRAFSQTMPAIDWTYANGFMWGLNGQVLFRTDLTKNPATVTGKVIGSLPSNGQYNAAWTYADGSLGFQVSDTVEGTNPPRHGTSVRVTSPDAAVPTATTYTNQIVSNTADGTSCRPGLQLTSPADGTYGSPYSQQLVSGGVAPYAVSKTGGALPPGLTLEPDGTLDGTATSAGTYTFTVLATDSAAFPATGAGSVTVTVDPALLTVTAPSPTMTYGADLPDLTPSYAGFVNHDDPTTLSTDPTCTTVPASSHHGDYPIACAGGVSDNYTFNYVNGTLTITPAALTITAPDAVMTYGDDVPALPDPTYDGLVNGDTAASLSTTPSCSTAAASTSSVGAYPVTCTGAVDNDYTISYAPGTMHVARKPLLITASSPTITYGESVPAVTPSYSGFTNQDDVTTLTTLPICQAAVTDMPHAGSYSTSCTDATSPNYDISYANGTLTVNPAALTVTASSPSMTYGGSVPAVIPSYDGWVNGDGPAALTHLATCSTTATASSGVGGYDTTCSGAASDDYAVTYVPGMLTVNAAALTITASDGTMSYGGTAPTITPTYTGLVNNDHGPATVPVCGTAATSTSHAGGYPSSCSGAYDPNYAISYVNGAVQVTPVALTITAPSAAMTYGGPVPALGAPAYAGFVNGDQPTSLTTQPSCSTTAAVTSPVGDYPTSCSGAVDSDYTITFAAGTMHVGQHALVVTAASPSMTYGGAMPAVTASYSGFVNGDGPSSLTQLPACSTAASSSSSVGIYPTSCSGATTGNYNVSYVPGTLTVNRAPLTITASDVSMVLGGAVPAVTPAYTGFVNNDTAASLTQTPTCSTSATSSSPVGNYATTCSGATSNNYSISYVNGTLSTLIVPGCGNDPHYGTGQNLAGQNLAGRNLANASLVGANLAGANLTGANLLRANLTGANLTGAVLAGANLQSATLTGANMHGADYHGANLQSALVGCANLSGANLKSVNLQGSSFTKSVLDGAFAPGANLQGSNFTNASAVASDFTGANMSQVTMTNGNLRNAVFKGANVERDVWGNTACVDGTNSTSDGGTCVGHLGA